MNIIPTSWRDAVSYVKEHHRHHVPPQGCKFAIALMDGDRTVGVLIAGRPVSRQLDDGMTLEITRCCTDGTKNACSMLYGAGCKIARAMGYTKIITYTLESECGASLRASNFKPAGTIRGKSWNTPSRKRVDKAPTVDKTLWLIT